MKKNITALLIICTFTILFSQKSIVTQGDSSYHKDSSILKVDTKIGNIEKIAPDKNESLKIWLPLITSLIVLLLSNGFLLYKINRDTREAIKKELKIAKIKFDRDRLEKFYDPILIALKTNSEIFNSYGPSSFPQDEGALENEASDVWKLIIENVIIPNNTKICDCISSSSHLIIEDDSIEPYLSYFRHAQSFKHFISYPNSIHKAFKYPIDFVGSVQKNREKILKNLNSTEKKFNT